MSGRVEAASQAFQHALPYLTYDAATREALAAADAVMFDDAAVERAAKALRPAAWDPEHYWPGDTRRLVQARYCAYVRTVFTVLKGDDK